jgi:dTDP-4-dehydrorhamnose 3,5-epimerase
MKLIQTTIPDVVIIEPSVFGDERGWFMESFNEKRFHDELICLELPTPRAFVQDNHSCSSKGVLRGLHYQNTPHAQGKLVRVIKGSVFDVAVDIRPESKTFGQHVSIELSAENKKMFWVPEGFAHGFLTLEDDTHFLYKTTDYYAKDCEGAIAWNDPELEIAWPEIKGLNKLLINEKDRDAQLFSAFKTQIKLI